jgi:uncharacterized protein (DUF427 family)
MESVWDYPRPPRLEHVTRHLRVVLGGVVIAETRRGARVLETSHPPVYYVSPEDILMEHLARSSSRESFCEWKGSASYYDLRAGTRSVRDGAWTYRSPTEAFTSIRDWVAFYPGRMDECTVDGEIVRPQAGGFYGGWITSDLEGPFKGDPGTEGW